jgi:hypothetical protein
MRYASTPIVLASERPTSFEPIFLDAVDRGDGLATPEDGVRSRASEFAAATRMALAIMTREGLTVLGIATPSFAPEVDTAIEMYGSN